MISKLRWLELREVDTTKYEREKQGMTYISWGDMETLLFTNLTDEELVPWESWVSNGTVYVQFFGYPVYSLAISDFRNNAIENPDATDVEDTRQRAFVKAASRCFGIGHKLYEASYHARKTPSRSSNTTQRPSNKTTSKKLF